MGFLKFLKREKKQGFDELDLPPAPPPLEGFEELPEPPDVPTDFEKISAPEQDLRFDFSESEEQLPELESMGLDKGIGISDSVSKDFEKEMAMPELTETEEPEPHPQKPIPNIPAAQTISAPSIEGYDDDIKEAAQEYPPKRLFAKPHIREKPTAKSIYVRVEDFKAMLGTINTIKSDLRKSEDALSKLEAIKNSKDRSFDRVKSHLGDLQKKLIFVDKTLFEEE